MNSTILVMMGYQHNYNIVGKLFSQDLEMDLHLS